MEAIRGSFVFEAAGTGSDGVQALPDRVQGMFAHAIKVTVPNFTNAITVSIFFYDDDGTSVLFTKATIAKNATTMVYPQVAESKPCPLIRKGTFDIVLSGAAGGTGGTVVVAIFPV